MQSKLSTNGHISRFPLVHPNPGSILREATILQRQEWLQVTTDGLGLGGSYDTTLEQINAQGGRISEVPLTDGIQSPNMGTPTRSSTPCGIQSPNTGTPARSSTPDGIQSLNMEMLFRPSTPNGIQLPNMGIPARSAFSPDGHGIQPLNMGMLTRPSTPTGRPSTPTGLPSMPTGRPSTPTGPPSTYFLTGLPLPSTIVPPMDDLEKEITIAVMGLTSNIHACPKSAVYWLRQLLGVGKSYFIREVSGISDIEVGGNRYSCKVVPCWRMGTQALTDIRYFQGPILLFSLRTDKGNTSRYSKFRPYWNELL